MKPTVSIIVPVYNASKYLTACMGSIMAQSYKDFEVILVDDGSTDGSAEICDRTASSDDRVTVVHQTNQGVSQARNRGIAEATGEWILFVDADDMLQPFCLERFMGIEEKCELTCFSFVCFEGEKETERHILEGRRSGDIEKESLRLRLDDSFDMYGIPWNKFFRRDIVTSNNVLFPIDLSYREDEVFMARYCRHIHSIQCLPDVMYRYRLTETGLTLGSRHEDSAMMIAKYLLENIPYCKNEEFRRFQYSRAIELEYHHIAAACSLSERKATALQTVRDALCFKELIPCLRGKLRFCVRRASGMWLLVFLSYFGKKTK